MQIKLQIQIQYASYRYRYKMTNQVRLIRPKQRIDKPLAITSSNNNNSNNEQQMAFEEGERERGDV